MRTIRSTSDEPALTYLLIGINVLVFLGAALGGASATGGGGVGGSQLLTDGALSRAAVADGEYWRIVTAGFLHAGFFHLLFNMLSLWILGSMLEPAIGRLRFGLIYFVSLLCGSFGALLLEPDGLTVGASGAIFGLMAAAAVFARNRGLSLMESGLGIWIVLNLVITFTVPNISIGGHIGGLIGGGLAAILLFDLGDQVRLPQAAAPLLCGALGVVRPIAVLGGSPVDARAARTSAAATPVRVVPGPAASGRARSSGARRRLEDVRVEDVAEQLDAVDEARSRPREVGGGVHGHDAGAERRQPLAVAHRLGGGLLRVVARRALRSRCRAAPRPATTLHSTVRDFSPGMPSTSSPPASSIICGTQWPAA